MNVEACIFPVTVGPNKMFEVSIRTIDNDGFGREIFSRFEPSRMMAVGIVDDVIIDLAKEKGVPMNLVCTTVYRR